LWKIIEIFLFLAQNFAIFSHIWTRSALKIFAAWASKIFRGGGPLFEIFQGGGVALAKVDQVLLNTQSKMQIDGCLSWLNGLFLKLSHAVDKNGLVKVETDRWYFRSAFENIKLLCLVSRYKLPECVF
jgi:hypothetical protein